MRIELDNYLLNPAFNAAYEVLEILSKHGEAYFVGGCVRDIIMGNKPKDFDISTNVPMHVTEKLFKTHNIGKNKNFGIVVVDYNRYTFEIANFRTDGAYSDNRRPDSVKLGVSFKEDTSRRDFTVNSLGMDINGNIIDYHGGINDIENKVLKTVGNPNDRITEDALRILRAIRFSIKFEFKLDSSLEIAIRKNRRLINNLSSERIKEEFEKMISNGSRNFSKCYMLMDNLGVLAVDKINIDSDPENSSTNTIIEKLCKYNTYSFIYCFSIIISEIYKSYYPYTSREKELLDHSVLSHMSELKFSNEEKDSILFIISNINNYWKLGEIPKKEALSIVRNKDFKELGMVVGFEYNNELINSILGYNSILEKRKLINNTLLNAKAFGKTFGKVSDAVIDWLFTIKEKGKDIPSDEDIIKFTELTYLGL